MKKLFITLVILSVCQITRAVDVNSLDPNLYLQKIRELEQTAKAQQQKIDQLTAALEDAKRENKWLRELCKKAGVKIPTLAPEETNFNSGEIVYRGKQRTPKWFDGMYEKFKDKIAFIDNNYIDIGEEILDSHGLQGIWVKDPRSEKRRMGVAPYESTILSALGNGEVLINYEYENILHIRGVEHNFVDGEPWPNGTPLIRNGTFNYTAANGQHRTVWSFVVYKPLTPLTKEQFAEAIKSGFVLVNYTKIGKNINKQPVP